MKIKTILIKPDMTTEEKINEYSYQAFCDVFQKRIESEYPELDVCVHGKTWIHSIMTPEGTYVHIHRQID
jgi:hypothetical protein